MQKKGFMFNLEYFQQTSVTSDISHVHNILKSKMIHTCRRIILLHMQSCIPRIMFKKQTKTKALKKSLVKILENSKQCIKIDILIGPVSVAILMCHTKRLLYYAYCEKQNQSV